MDSKKKLKLYKLISALIIAVGALLMIYMISVESEPGAVPLLLLITGTGGYLLT